MRYCGLDTREGRFFLLASQRETKQNKKKSPITRTFQHCLLYRCTSATTKSEKLRVRPRGPGEARGTESIAEWLLITSASRFHEPPAAPPPARGPPATPPCRPPAAAEPFTAARLATSSCEV